MDGAKLVFGTLAAGVAASALARRARGSADRPPCNPLTLTTQGFPWPAEYDLYHATTAMNSIMSSRFKVRHQLRAQKGQVLNATGGGTSEAVSFTLDRRVAEAIVVGLLVIRKIARRELSLAELIRRYRRECPKGWAMLTEARPWMLDAKKIRMEDEGWIDVESGREVKSDFPLGYYLRPGAIPHEGSTVRKDAKGRKWVGRFYWPYNRRHELTWKNAKALARAEERYAENDTAVEAYKAMLAFGSSSRECYDPLFFGTDAVAVGRIDPRDVGIITARSNVPRVALGGGDARRLGYLRDDEARYLGDDLSGWERACERAVTGGWMGSDPTLSSYYARSVRPGEKLGPWMVAKRDTKVTNKTTMTYLHSMAELRVYNPKAITLVRSMGSDVVLREAGLVDRITRPWFRSTPQKPLPGTMVRECRMATDYAQHQQARRKTKAQQDALRAVKKRGWVQAKKGGKYGSTWVLADNPIWNVPEGDEQRFEIKTTGYGWNLVTAIRGLAVDGEGRIYGMRTMNQPKEEGYGMNGWISVKGKKCRAFTSSMMFERSDGSLIDVAVLYIVTRHTPAQDET